MTKPSNLPSTFAEEEAHHPFLHPSRYQAYFFGPFRVTLDGQSLGELSWRRNKAKALLKWFLLSPGDLFALEQLGRLFWPNVTPKSAMSNLHVTIHYLRHMLEPELAPGRPSTFIRRNRHNYYWFELNDVWWTDVLETQHLSTLIKEAERCKEMSRAIALSRQLISYYKQKFLPEDVYEDIFSAHRRQHDYAYTQLLKQLIQFYMHTDQLDEALSCAFQILSSVDPYSEEAVKTIVHIHLRQENTTGAIRYLDNFQSFLKQDLGIEPGEELLKLRRYILSAF
jgi:DNA-binding SARP family transcriptional activator